MGLIAGSDKIINSSAPPNFPPEWSSQPTPSFLASTTATYDFNNNTFDPDDAVLIYTLSSGSTALSTAFTLSTDGVLFADGTQAAGNLSGIIVDVDDGTNDPVASNAFSIAVTVQSNTSPSLWQDFGGNDFAGEAGAVAVNDDWASTIYEYVPQFAPTVPTLPTPTTGAALPTENGVNPNAADEYFAFNRTGLSTALNNATYRVIFCAKGSDCSDGTDSDSMTLTISGSSGTPRWIIYYDPDGTIDVETFAGAPWNQSYANRVQMPLIIHSSADYTYMVGLSWGIIGGQVMRCARYTGTASNNLVYRCNMENGTDHVWLTRDSSDNNVAYQCVSHDHIAANGSDTQAFQMFGGTNHKVVSCEGWDILGDFFHNELAGVDGAVCEDNDIYRKTFYDGNGALDPNGNYGAGEGGVDLKDTDNCKVYGNRIWNMRRKDTIAAGGSGSGTPVNFSLTSEDKYKVDIRWNVISDCTDGCFNLRSIGPGTNGNHSIVRNIVSNITQLGDTPVFYVPHPASETYLNTVTDCLSCDLWYNYIPGTPTPTIALHDCLGNFFQDTSTILNESQWGANFGFGYNAYAGSYEKQENYYTSTDYEAASKAALNMGDFKYRRKKLTVDGGEVHTISGIVPTTSTPVGFKQLVPVKPAADAPGSRSGIGVDDTY